MVLYALVAIVGATMELGLMWNIAETFNGLMAIPNLIAVFLLSGVVVKLVKEYFAGKASTHLVGILGGCIWGLGTALSYIAAGKAGAAISYALGQGAPMIAALWGVFIWKEFTGSSKSTDRLLGIMFILFITGLSFIVLSGGN